MNTAELPVKTVPPGTLPRTDRNQLREGHPVERRRAVTGVPARNQDETSGHVVVVHNAAADALHRLLERLDAAARMMGVDRNDLVGSDERAHIGSHERTDLHEMQIVERALRRYAGVTVHVRGSRCRAR